MEVTIDLSNKTELRRLKRELTRYLNVIDFAMKEEATAESGHNDDPLPLTGKVAPNEGVSTVLGMIEALPKTFTSSALYKLTGESVSRGVVKAALLEAVTQGKIKEVEKGIGRRPSKYKKI